MVPEIMEYDRFGNHRGRICPPAGPVRLFSEAVIRESGELDAYAPDAAQLDVSEIPTLSWSSYYLLRVELLKHCYCVICVVE